MQYCDEAKLRVAQQGSKELQAFFDELPASERALAIKPLPAVDGFRKNSSAEVKERTKKFINVLVHASDPRFRNHDIEWGVFGWVWGYFAFKKFGDSFFLDPTELNAMGPSGAQHFLQELIRRCDESICDRETIEKLLLYGPFADSEEASKLVGTLPSRAKLDQELELSRLPNRVTILSERVDALEVSLDSNRQELDKVAFRMSSAGESSSRLEEKVGVIDAKLEELRDSSLLSTKEVDRKLSLVRQELSEAVSLSGVYGERLDSISSGERDSARRIDEVLVSLTALERSVRLLEANSQIDRAIEANEGTGVSNCVGLHRVERDWGRTPVSESGYEEARGILCENFLAAGIASEDADMLAQITFAAAVSGQLIQFSGSLADILAEATSVSLSGREEFTWHVPLGLCDGELTNVVLTRMKSKKEGVRCLVLKGVNRSAFEIYGDALRDQILRRQLGCDECLDFGPIIATWVDGPSVLQGGVPLLELGPMVNSDQLKWGRTRWGKLQPSVFVPTLQDMHASKASLSQEKADILEAIEGLGLRRTQLRHRLLQRALTVLMRDDKGNSNQAFNLMLAAWVIPWAMAHEVRRSDFEHALVKVVPDFVESTLVARVLAGLQEEIEL